MSNLKFNKIIIQNFKSFIGEHVLELDRGGNLIYVTGDNKLEPELGTNGVGKTSMWDALFWVMWNKTERDKRPADAIEPWGSDGADCVVALYFTKLGSERVLTRTRNPNRLTITTKDTVKEISQNDVVGIFGFTEEIFRRSVVLGQHGKLFLDLKPEEQSEMFNDALSLDIYLKAADLARKRQQGEEDKLRVVEKEIDKLSGRIDELKESITQQEALSSGFERSRKEQMTELKQAISKRTKITEDLLDTVKIEAPRRAQDRGKALRAIKAQADKVQGSWGILGREKADLEEEISGLRVKLKLLNSEVEKYRTSIKENRVCPACGQKVPLDHLRGKESDVKKKIRMTDTRLETAQVRLDDLNSEIKKDEKELETFRSVFIELDKCFLALDTQKAQLQKLEDETNPFEESIKALKVRRRKTRLDRVEQKQKMEKIQRKAEMCKYWNGAFKEIRLGVIDQVLAELKIVTNQHVEALGLHDWNIEFRTERETKAGGVTLAFTTYLYPPNRKEPIKWESYSGGESQRWQLAVAFGLSEVLLNRSGVNINIEVLDEPTKGISQIGHDHLLEHLSERAKELERTIYFCDQHSMDRGDFDEVLTITKDKEGSHING